MKKKINSFPIDDHLILQTVLTNQFLILNETAKTIWQSFESGLSREEICTALCTKYGIAQRQAVCDVSFVFRLLKSAGLLAGPDRCKPLLQTETKEASADNSLDYKGGLQQEICVHYSFNGRDFSIYYGDQQLKDHIHALISHFEHAPLKKSINTYTFAKCENQFAVIKNEQILALDEEEFRARNILLHEILADAYSGIEFGAIIHASAVEKKGRCILLPAVSGSGKSTLTAALLKAGFSYMGDDYIPLAADSFDALPVPFSLSIKDKSWDVLNELYPELNSRPVFHWLNKTNKYLTPPGLPACRTFTGVPVKFIVYPRYVPHASTVMKDLPAVASFQNILEAYSWLDLDARYINRFIKWLQRTKSYSLTYSSLAEAIQLIESLLCE
jgi:hypothetical protein